MHTLFEGFDGDEQQFCNALISEYSLPDMELEFVPPEMDCVEAKHAIPWMVSHYPYPLLRHLAEPLTKLESVFGTERYTRSNDDEFPPTVSFVDPHQLLTKRKLDAVLVTYSDLHTMLMCASMVRPTLAMMFQHFQYARVKVVGSCVVMLFLAYDKVLVQFDDKAKAFAVTAKDSAIAYMRTADVCVGEYDPLLVEYLPTYTELREVFAAAGIMTAEDLSLALVYPKCYGRVADAYTSLARRGKKSIGPIVKDALEYCTTLTSAAPVVTVAVVMSNQPYFPHRSFTNVLRMLGMCPRMLLWVILAMLLGEDNRQCSCFI